MKAMSFGIQVLAVFSLVLPAVCRRDTTSPVTKVLQLLSDLQGKIISEGETATKTYAEFAEWCEERSKNLGFEIKTGKAESEELGASISKESATIANLNAKLDELAAKTATNEGDLKAATGIRAQEAKDFAASEKELMGIISALQRAIGILEKEMQKTGSASLVQLGGASNVAEALGALVQASALSSADAQQLTALVQNSQQAVDSEGDSSLGAPDAAVYKGQSRGIINTLEDLLEKAQAQLATARKEETTAIHQFELLKQSLEDEMKFAAKETAEAQKGIAAGSGQKAADEGDLKSTSKELKADISTLASLHHNCMTKAQEYEAQTRTRGEELQALASAKKALTDNTGDAAQRTYSLSQMAFVQISRSGFSSKLASSADLANFEAVRFIRDLARKQGSTLLAQLAARLSVYQRAGAGDDPFGKVKGLIKEMIERLESEADADASHKAYCDKEMSETHTKKDDKNAEIEKLTTKIDQMTARSSELKAEVAALQKALAELAKAQAEMDTLRSKEKSEFEEAEADMKQGLEGVKMALKILREYYAAETAKAHVAAEGAGSSIIGLLEVVESDFEKNLVGLTTTEEEAKNLYEQGTKENEIEKTTKEQDVKYKNKEASELDQAVAELSSDRSTVEAELAAVMEYLKSLEAQCIAKAETYEERKARFEAELAGLQEALRILDGQAMLLQKSSKRTVRAVHSHGAA